MGFLISIFFPCFQVKHPLKLEKEIANEAYCDIKKACNTFISAYIGVQKFPQRQTGREMSTRRTVGKKETGTVNCRMRVIVHTHTFRTNLHAQDNMSIGYKHIGVFDLIFLRIPCTTE